MSSNQKNIVFLSHSSKDKKQLVPFKKALEEKTNGTIQFFLSSDGQSLPLGHNWVASVEHSLDEAKLAFVFLTPNSIGSSWVAFEAGYMHAKKIRVIPVGLAGIELGNIRPPLGLLQGFNMHSHETMNNVFEILNKEFNHQHKLVFTAEDYRTLFGADSEMGGGFFGEFSAFVAKMTFHGTTKDESLSSILKTELAQQGIHLVESSTRDGKMFVCPGLSLSMQKDKTFYIELHSKMFGLILAGVCSALKQLDGPFPQGAIYFSLGIVGHGFDTTVTARAYATEFKVEQYGVIGFRNFTLVGGIRTPLILHTATPFDVKDIRDLVIQLFECQMVEFQAPIEME